MSEQRMFTCDECRGVFPMGDDEEALSELQANFPGRTIGECGLTCDDCYTALTGKPVLYV